MPNGDITLTTAKTITVTGLVLQTFLIDFAGSNVQISFAEVATGNVHVVRLTDAACIGFDLTAGVFTDGVARAITGEMTKLLGVLFGAGASTAGQRKTNAVQTLITDGVITVAGTVA